MKECVEVEGRAGLLKHIRENVHPLPEFEDDAVLVEPYTQDLYIVYLPGYGVLGFCEGPAK